MNKDKIIIWSTKHYNKDDNVHRYAVRRGKKIKKERERDRRERV